MIRELTLEQCLDSDAPECGLNVCQYIKKLFDFDYCMPEPYKTEFEYKFFLRYRYQAINYTTFGMFKNFLHSKLIELLPRYIKLYESQDLIFNPFINYAVRMDSFAKNQSRNKNYSTNTGNDMSHSSNANGQVNIGTGIENNTGNESSINSSDSVDTAKSTSDKRVRHNKYFTDAPQNQNPDNDNKLFNQGYITDHTLDTDKQGDISSGVNTGYNKGASESSHTNANTSRSMSETVGEGEAKAYAQFYKDGYDVGALRSTLKNAMEEAGIKGVTVSAILLEWRKTFINVDKQLLDELDVLFMRVF